MFPLTIIHVTEEKHSLNYQTLPTVCMTSTAIAVKMIKNDIKTDY